MAKINLIIEKGNDGKLWGRVNYRSNLMIDVASTVDVLERKIQKLIKDFYNTHVVFEHTYDVSAFFENYDFINQIRIAELAGISPSLIKHYAKGTKHPTAVHAKKIEMAIHKLAKELQSVPCTHKP
jgi:hemoglobin-like flavoprotein